MKRRFLRKIVLVGLIFLLSFSFFLPKTQALTNKGKPVIAYYFNYWGAPWGRTVDRGWGRWAGFDVNGNEVNPDRVYPNREPWRREIITGDWVTYPLIGPYDSSNPEVVRWQARNAKNAGIDAFAIMMWDYEFDKSPKTDKDTQKGEKMWWVAENVTVPLIEEEGFHFIIGDEMVEATHIDCDYQNNNSCPLHFDGALTVSFSEMPDDAVQKLKDRGLTHKRYADVVLNAYAALSKWKDSSAYLRIDGKPVYFVPLLEHYREYPGDGRLYPYHDPNVEKVQKFKKALELVEELIGEQVYWFGYDGYVTWGDPTPGAPETDLVHCGRCADIWKGIIDGLIDGFGISKSFLYSDEIVSQAEINYFANEVALRGFNWIPNLETSFDDSMISDRRPDDPFAAAWMKRKSGETFRKNIRVFENAPRQDQLKFYWLSSWNATYLEGYTVEPAAMWGDDPSLDPYKYLKILADDLTGTVFSPAPLPPIGMIDPLRARELFNGADIKTLLSRYGSSDPDSDLNSDGIVNGIDFGEMVRLIQ